MPPQQPAIGDAPRHHQPQSQAAAKNHRSRKTQGKTTLSQKELSVVVMLLAAETAVVTTTAPAPAGSATPTTTTIFSISAEAAQAAGLSWLARQPLPKVDAATIALARDAFTANGPEGLNGATRKAITSFMPWRDCLALRQCSKSWKLAADETVRVATLPSKPDVPAMFLPCPRDVDADAVTEARLKCRHPAKWRCAYCGFCNSETRILCGNRHCQIPCPSHLDCARLFLGQLRREGTVPFITWLVEGVLGSDGNPLRIVNAENHRQLSTGRGKGCAWIYLESRTMAPTVLTYHHRVFADVDPVTKREGVWIVPAKHTDDLGADVASRATYDTSRSLVLPRGSLVVEYPSRQPYTTLPPESFPAGPNDVPPQHQQSPMQMGADLPPPAYQQQAPGGFGAGEFYPQQQHQSHPYAQRSAAAKHGELVDGQWIAPMATDSPPSEASGDEKASPMAASTSTIPGANTSSVRRHQPYRSPVAAGTPSIPTASQSPMMSGEPNLGSFSDASAAGYGPHHALPPMMAGYHGANPPRGGAGRRRAGGNQRFNNNNNNNWRRAEAMYADAYYGGWEAYADAYAPGYEYYPQYHEYPAQQDGAPEPTVAATASE